MVYEWGYGFDNCNFQLSSPNLDKELISIFPNPTSEIITIENDRPIKVRLKDINGKILSNHISFSGSLQINLSNYSEGIYFISIEDETSIITKKIVKQ